MFSRLTLVSCLTATVLAGAGPALAGTSGPHAEPRPDGDHRTGGPRTLHPLVSSGGWSGALAPRVAPYAGVGARSDEASWRVVPGVTYTRWTQTDPRGPIRAHLLTVNPRTPGLTIDYASMGQVRRVAPVRDILARNGAIAGVNGDFYDIRHTYAPLGLGKDRQRGLLNGRVEGWNKAFFITRSGHPEIDELPMRASIAYHPRLRVTNLNSPFVYPGGIGVYTPRWGDSAGYQVTQGQQERVRGVNVVDGRVVSNRARLTTDRPIRGLLLVARGDAADQLRRQLPVGTRVRVSTSVEGHPQMAITGNNFLVRDGVIRAIDDRTLAPRTAIGIDDDTGEILVLVVDGRSTQSRGYTMVELANLMVDLGADEALNLDGGGSSTMVARNRRGVESVLNTPSDGFQRWVANAVAISYQRPS